MTNTNHLYIKHNYVLPEGAKGYLLGISRFNLTKSPDTRRVLRWLKTRAKKAFKSFATTRLRMALETLRVQSKVPLDKLATMADSWNKESDGWKLVTLLGRLGMPMVEPVEYPKLMTLDIKVERSGKNAPWQDIKVRYANGWYGFLNDRPMVTISLQGFLKKHLKQEPSNDLLKQIMKEVCGWVELDVHVATLESCGSTRDYRRKLAHIYTSYCGRRGEGDDYPSVAGSCMGKEPGYDDDEDNRYFCQTEGNHPVEAYATEDIGIAYCTDRFDRTTMRALLNLRTRTVSRYYGSSGGKLRIAEENQFFNDLKEQGFTRSEATGLKGCRLLLLRTDHETRIVLPYIDSTAQVLWTGEELRVMGDDGLRNTTCGDTNGLAELPSITCSLCQYDIDENTYGTWEGNSSRSGYTCRCCAEKLKERTNEAAQ